MPTVSNATVRVEYAVPKQKVEHALERYVTRLKTRVSLRKVILFGSYARDSYSHGSDVDLLIVADDLPSDQSQRYTMFKDTLIGLDLQPFSYTTQEWSSLVKTGSGFAREVRQHGIAIYPRKSSRRKMSA